MNTEAAKSAVPTIKEFLVTHFGKSAEGIQGINDPNIGGAPCHHPHFVCDEAGRLFVICSGYVLMSFKPDPGFKGTVYLIRDDYARDAWYALRARGEAQGSCPSPMLRLVYSI